MRTLKAIRITAILDGLFCFFCIASTVCFAINRYFELRVFFDIGTIFIYGWIINPSGIISFIVCLVLFLIARKDPQEKEAIGRNWLWIFIRPVILSVIYLTAGVLTVVFTGGV